MRLRCLLVSSLVALGCGRTNLLDDADGGADGGADAGVVPDAGVVQRAAPLFVATSGVQCPTAGVELDLKVTTSSERLALVQTKALDECSGAGGEYLIGREVGVSRDLFLGQHACYFLNAQLRTFDGTVYWGVARLSQNAGLTQTPTSWCITTLAGTEPVISDSTVKAWAVYPTEADARAALNVLAQP